ncbi:MAG: DUF4190 domain-containing protein [Eubacterium sp.]|nr:DUF4190 domain-containing protein [Eubacterium sp.]
MDNYYNEPNKPEEYSYEEIPPTEQPTYDPVYTEPPKPEKTGMAVASLVLGIVAVVLSCTYVNVVLAIISIILGVIYLVKKPTARKGMAIAGIILSIASIVILIALVAVGIFVLSSGLYDVIMNDVMLY